MGRQFLINMKNDCSRFDYLMSSLFDLAIFFLITFMIAFYPGYAFFKDVSNVLSLWLFILSAVGGICVSFVFAFLFIILFKGSTLGMRIFGLKFITLEDVVFKTSRIVLKYFISMVIFVITLGFSGFANFLAVSINKNKRNFFDYLFQTKAVAI